MTLKQAMELHKGDEVTWNDPDEGRCTRTIIINTVEIDEDVVKITDPNGDYLECLIGELE